MCKWCLQDGIAITTIYKDTKTIIIKYCPWCGCKLK